MSKIEEFPEIRQFTQKLDDIDKSMDKFLRKALKEKSIAHETIINFIKSYAHTYYDYGIDAGMKIHEYFIEKKESDDGDKSE